MIKLKLMGTQNTGKTARLIKEAVESDAYLVVPTARHKIEIQELAFKLTEPGAELPTIITVKEMVKLQALEADHKYLIDNLDGCL